MDTKQKIKDESIFQGIVQITDSNDSNVYQYEQSTGKVFHAIPSDPSFIFIGCIKPNLKQPSIILKHCRELEWVALSKFIKSKFLG